MSDRAQKIKSIVKNTPPKSTYGTDPKDPWSARANITEDAILDKYLLSRGINPKFATKDQKVAHSKTGQFNKWKQDHMRDLGEGISLTHTPTQMRLHALKKSQHVNTEIRVADGHKQLHPQNESVDKKDTVTLDIPLLIRVLELAREDIKTDMDLHRVVEKLINIRTKGMLTMKDYNYIARIHEEVVDENHIAVAMGKELDDEGSMVMNQLDQMERSINMLRDVVKDPKMQLPGWVQSKVTLAADYIETVAGYMSSKNEQTEKEWEKVAQARSEIWRRKQLKKIDEVDMSSTLAAFNKDKPSHAQAKIDTRTAAERKAETEKMLAARKKETPAPAPVKSKPVTMDDIHKQIAKSYSQHKPGQYVGDSVEHDDTPIIEAQSAAIRFQKALQREKAKREEQERKDKESKARAEKLLNPQKPVQEADCGCSDVPPEDKDKKLIQMSKSARIIKSIYKKQGVTEDMYDHEKEDKSVATYGKKPKVSTIDPKQSFGDKKPEAAAILTGGTTLTGQKRDTVEIDPMMRMRPGQPDPTKKTGLKD